MTPYARTMTQITDDTMRLIREFRGSKHDGKQWTYEEVYRQVCKAVLELVEKTGILKAIRSILIQQNVYVYDMPPDNIRLLRASVNGLDGHVVMPYSRSSWDYERSSMPTTTGDPLSFFRFLLNPNQIGFVPGPSLTGSGFTRDSLYGLIRAIRDETPDYLPYDAVNPALRDVDGIDVRILRSGDGQIIRDVLMPDGNIQVTYVRMPYIPDDPNGYMDSEIPDWVHKDVKYGASGKVLRSQTDNFSMEKRQFFGLRWASVISSTQRYAEHKGELDGVRPL